jgi:hypothetical protein
MMAELHPVEKEQVMAFLDGELEPKLAAQVAAHIEGCADCRKLQNDLRGVSSQMLAWNVEPVPTTLIDAVNAEAQAKPSNQFSKQIKLRVGVPLWRRILFSRVIWAGACLLVCVGITLKVFAPTILEKQGSRMPYFAASRVERADKLAQESRVPLPSPLAKQVPARGGGGGGDDNLRFDRSPLLYAPAPGLSELERDVAVGPMIARTASLKISVKDVDAARVGVDGVILQYHGYSASITIHSEVGSPRSIESEVHVPSAQSDAALAALRSLGRVEQEEQGGEEVTAQVIDLNARLKNARESEIRLQEILRTRPGKVSEVLEVEQAISETRENIERMEAEQKELRGRIAFSSIKLELHEEYQATLGQGASVGRQVRNAIVDGFQAAGSGALAIGLWLFSTGPSLLLAVLLLYFPARWTWRRYSKRWQDWMARQNSIQG